jgi:hypothetical protein
MLLSSISRITLDEESKDCVLEAIKLIVEKIPGDDRNEFLNRKTKESVGGCIKDLSTLDYCKHLMEGSNGEILNHWRAIHDSLNWYGAEASKEPPIEKRLAIMEAKMEKCTLTKMLAFLGILTIHGTIYNITHFLLDKSGSKMSDDEKLVFSFCCGIFAVIIICCVCQFIDTYSGSKIDCANAEPLGCPDKEV